MKKLLIFSTLLISLSGCSVVPFIANPIVTGVVMWYEGEAHKYYDEEALTIYRVTKNVLKKLNHPITKDQSNQNGGFYLIAGDKDRFKIVIRRVKPHITEVKVRVNFMGDKPYAELLYRQIDLNTNSIEFDNKGLPTKNSLIH